MSIGHINVIGKDESQGRLSLLRQDSSKSCITLIARSQHWLLRAVLMGDSSLFQCGSNHLRPFG
ncbi:Hypothetical protein FKW44_011282 [Caligus rogercresseyi]|uniref:Uncharacterized protein n=1 Tax=Caligus rogercresseyi TaxID=217165 RepID=A0A7T8K8Q2_CALRO|nr:Hypothetical protein FKW44_011282 [Caligus rogercresseyi]